MNIHVYDTHVHTSQGQHIHFDVLVNDANVTRVKSFAENYLTSLGVEIGNINQSRCNFCHSESATPEVRQTIINQGHSIIRLK